MTRANICRGLSTDRSWPSAAANALSEAFFGIGVADILAAEGGVGVGEDFAAVGVLGAGVVFVVADGRGVSEGRIG